MAEDKKSPRNAARSPQRGKPRRPTEQRSGGYQGQRPPRRADEERSSAPREHRQDRPTEQRSGGYQGQRPARRADEERSSAPREHRQDRPTEQRSGGYQGQRPARRADEERSSAPRPRAGQGDRRPAATAKARLAASRDTSWNDVAEWYNSLLGNEGSDYHQQLIHPGVERLLRHNQGDLAGRDVLDIACGQGVLCRYLVQKGATVTGIDLSEALLAYAEERLEPEQNLRYARADATALLNPKGQLLPEWQESSYDAVTLVLAAQNMTPLSNVWRAVSALLRPGGALVVVVVHPCFRIPQHSNWHWNAEEHRQERTVWRYLSSAEIGIKAHPGRSARGEASAQTTHFHRPLQAYINTLGNAGLWIDHIEEWCSHKQEQPGVKSEAIDTARNEIPMFLAFRARKAV